MTVQSESNHLVADQIASAMPDEGCSKSVDTTHDIVLTTSGSSFASSLATVREQHKKENSMLTASKSFKAKKPLIVGDAVLTNKRCVDQWNNSYSHIHGLKELTKYVHGDIVGPYARSNIFQSFRADKCAMFWTGLCYLHGFGCEHKRTNGFSIIYAAAVAGCPESMNYLGLCCFLGGDVTSALVWFKEASKRGYPLDNFSTLCQLYGLSSAARQRLTIL